MKWRDLFDYLSDLEFFIKITLACVLFQWLLFNTMGGNQYTLIEKIVIYWLVNITSYYATALLIEKVIKKNRKIAENRGTRITKVAAQPYTSVPMTRFFLSLVQNFVIAGSVIILLREVEREVHFGKNFAWFFMSIIVTDFAFYAHHNWLLHNRKLKSFLKIHAEHHRYKDSSAFVTGHKDLLDMIINFFLADMIVLIIFGFDFYQLLAWTVVINLFNVEGHSAVSLLFIGTDFHDRHHTNIRGNYGINGFWDKIFGTFITANRRTGFFFPANTLGRYFQKRFQ